MSDRNLLTMAVVRKYWPLIIFALPFFVALEDSSLWDSNEAFYAQTPREMLSRGDWVTPYFNNQPRLDKPPLTYWIVASFYRIFSPSILWERVPMALIAYGSVLAVFSLGKMLFNMEAGLLAAGIFATSFRMLILSRRLIIDVLLLFLLLLAIVSVVSWVRSNKNSYLLLCGFFLGLGFLTKGPVVFLVTPCLILYIFAVGGLQRLTSAPWLATGIICLLTSSSWFFLLAMDSGWQPILDFIFKENIARFWTAGFGPTRGLFYYVGVFLGDFFPWSIFFPTAAVWVCLRIRKQGIGVDAGALILLGVWVTSFFIIFSLSSNKQEYYILPVYPAAALCIAGYLQKGRISRVPCGLVVILILIASGALLLLTNDLFEGLLRWCPFFFIPAIVTFFPLRRLLHAAVCLSFFYASAFAIYLSPLEAYRPVRHFAHTIQEKVRGKPMFEAGYYKIASPSLAFYLDRPIHEIFLASQAADLLNQTIPVYLIVRAEDFHELSDVVDSPLKIVEERRKLYTNLRTLVEGFKRGQSNNPQDRWTRSVFLISNQNGG